MPMSQKGDKVGQTRYVFRRSESQPSGVVATVRVAELDLETKEYHLEIIQDKGVSGRKTIGELTANATDDGKVITIPESYIEENDAIKPGVSTILNVYDVGEPDDGEDENQISDHMSVLGRDEVKGRDDKTSDKCDSRLICEAARKYLDGNGKRAELKFRNLRTQKEVTGMSHSKYSNSANQIQFKIGLREQIDAQPGDLIEIIKPRDEKDAPEDVEDMIREMHSMMMEMYNDYKESKNE